MQTEHRIDELIVDLSFNTTRLARHETALLSEWLSEDLLPALDNIFSHYSPGKQILRFETLEFDFGNLASRHYQQAIREQLLKQVAQLLEAQLLAVVPENRRLGASLSPRNNSNAELALKQLFSYLATGQLAAHRPVSHQSPALHAQLLDAVIAQHNIADLLRELPQRDLLIQRLLTQFTLVQRVELLRQLAPQQVQHAIALLDLLQLFERDSHAVQQTVWEALLNLGLAQPQTATQVWIDYLLRKLANTLALSEVQLQQALIAIRFPIGAAATALEDVQILIAHATVDNNFVEVSANSVANLSNNLEYRTADSQYSFDNISLQSHSHELPMGDEQQFPEQLRQLVAAALIRADTNQLQKLWPQLIAHDQLLIAALLHYLPQAEIRQQLMLRLPLALQADIVAVLVPALKEIFYRLQHGAIQLNDFITAQLKSFTSLVASSENNNDKKSQNNSQNEHAAERQPAELVARKIWEITLSLLFNGSSINSDYQRHGEVFLLALAQRYAELHNLDEKPLQQILQQLVFDQQQEDTSNSHYLSSQNTESIQTELDGISRSVALQQNQQELQKTQEEQKLQEQQPSSLVSDLTLVSASIAPTNSDVTVDSSHLTANNLVSVSDHQLFDLCLRLKSGALAWSSLAADVVLLQRLISSYIRLGHSATAENCADFVAAINAQAKSSPTPAIFYLAVLQTLISDKLIDLELISQNVQDNETSQQADIQLLHYNKKHQSVNENIIEQQVNCEGETPVASVSNPVKLIGTESTNTADLNMLALQLQQGKITPESLDLNNSQHSQLVDIFIATENTIAADIKTDLLAAIHQQAQQANYKDEYYRRVIQAVLQDQPIDLEAFAVTTGDNQPFHSEPAIDYSLLTGSDNSVRTPALSLAQLFMANQPLTQEQLLTLQQHVNLLLNHPNPTLIAEWSQLLALANNAQLLIQLVPAHLLHQIMLRLQPARYTALDAVVKVVLEALALLVNDLNSLAIKQVKWEFIIRYLLAVNDNPIITVSSESAQTLSIELCEYLAPAAGIDDVQRLVDLTQRRMALLKPVAQQKPAMRLQELNTNPATQSDENTPQWESGLHINNAGQVLAGAFLPRLFSMLNLIQDGKFIHADAADRAVHLVQYMVTGESSTPEYDLILNKILCGISTSIPVSAGIDITEQEQTLIEQMLTSMIQHWKVLGATSISGLRETFFQRQGWLILEEDCWRLKVKEQTFDLLLDRLPWSISLIKHGWMDKPLRVSWRNHS